MTRFKIFRFTPELDKKPWYETYELEVDPNTRILDCLHIIRDNYDPSLAYRWSCSHGICGSCGVTINGLAALACQKLVKHYVKAEEIKIEPLGFFPIVKDLIVDMEVFFERMKSIHPRNLEKINPVSVSRQLHQSPEEYNEIVDAIKCVMCGCCTAQCPVTKKEEPEFIGPAAVLRAKRYIFDTRLRDTEERRQIIGELHGVWSCKTYWRCTRVCPKGIHVTQNILDLKEELKTQ
ncbi:MAG: succinate dehydrogenase/fumarate reductase iron-sulfur subunit [Candidatus Bathyarchaeota archaeon]